jgi:hypothetical protein
METWRAALLLVSPALGLARLFDNDTIKIQDLDAPLASFCRFGICCDGPGYPDA